MKLIKVIFLLIFLQPFTGVLAQEQTELTQVDLFGKNPGSLKMFIYSNGREKDSLLKPLVIVLHGCGQSADGVARLTGWNKLAYLNDFMIVYPQQKFINNVSTCFN